MTLSETALVACVTLIALLAVVCVIMWVRQRPQRSYYQRRYDDDRAA